MFPILLVLMGFLTMMGALTTMCMRYMQSRLEPWDDSRNFKG
jgi:hypothetical protein